MPGWLCFASITNSLKYESLTIAQANLVTSTAFHRYNLNSHPPEQVGRFTAYSSLHVFLMLRLSMALKVWLWIKPFWISVAKFLHTDNFTLHSPTLDVEETPEYSFQTTTRTVVQQMWCTKLYYFTNVPHLFPAPVEIWVVSCRRSCCRT